MAAGYCYCLGIKSNNFFLKDNKKAFILWLNVPKVTAYYYLLQKASDIGMALPLVSMARKVNENKVSKVVDRFLERVRDLDATTENEKNS